MNVAPGVPNVPGRSGSKPSLAAPAADARQAGERDSTDAAPDAAPCTIQAAFEAQVAQRPAAIAILSGEEKLSYLQLDVRANRLARHLAAQGIGPESVVALALPRSIDMVVAVIAVLKAGGAYLPLDPGQPSQRTEFMLGDSGAAYLVCNRETLDQLGGATGSLPVLCLDDKRMRGWVDSLPGHGLGGDAGGARATPENLAYIIYTSGSTGAPKGVAVTQRSVVNLAWQPNYVEITPADTILQFAPFAFDAATFEVWGALLNGARLLLGPAGRADITRLSAEVFRHKVTIAWFTAGLFELVATSALPILASLRQLLAGGDVLSVPAVSRVQTAYPALRLINGYGPTETTTFACTHTIAPTAGNSPAIPIGRPIGNARVFILDTSLKPVGLGVAGELYIAGTGLARGYQRRPGLTAERFIACPFGPPGARMYRTGDLARLREDGDIDFLGRIDDQAKIRGVRIEPGEIEAVLTAIDAISQAAVVPRKFGGDTRLVAYIVHRSGQAPPSEAALREALASRLPDYMIPVAFVALAALPLSPNGKLDRAALPQPEARRQAGAQPSGSIARRFAEIWKELLGTGEIDPAADLFALGGDSLSAFAFLSRVEAEFGRGIAAEVLLQSPTIEGLAEAFGRDSETQGNDVLARLRSPGDRLGGKPGREYVTRLRLVRAAAGVSRGVVLGMPGYIGNAAEIGIIAAHALQDYDVWTFSVDAGGRKLTEDGLWLDVARDLANRLLDGEVPWLRALVGFSLGGYMAWLVDRLMVVRGREPTPIVNVDGDALHFQFKGWQERIEALVWQQDARQAARMLLLRRAWPRRFAPIEDVHNLARGMDTDWQACGASPVALRFRTLDHLDIVKPAAIAASREALASFIEGAEPRNTSRPESLEFDTIGGLVFRILDDTGPLQRSAAKDLVESDKLPQDPTVKLALLVLSVKLGEPDRILELAGRIGAVEPSRPATYAQIRFLAELGRSDEAHAVMNEWCTSYPGERHILERALRNGEAAHAQSKHSGEVSGERTPILRGFVDHVGVDVVEGWVQDSAQPEEPVCLDILVDEAFTARVLANGHRSDLLATGQGSGCHAFSVRLPFQMSPAQRKRVIVRRSSDHVVVPWTSDATASVAN